jgi:serine/threonine protein phosphatase PrpC
MRDWTCIGTADGGVLLAGGIRGANHRDRGQPCQDACLAGLHSYKGYPYVLLAVADGHGANGCPRSHLGAHFAIRAVADLASRWIIYAVECLEASPSDWLSGVSHEFAWGLPRRLRQLWFQIVCDHLRGSPLEDKDEIVEASKAYGTTVALALAFNGQLFAGAIGDSAIDVVTDTGRATLAVDILEDGENGANHLGLTTDSLASTNAAARWRYKILPLDQVRLVAAATDGFADSLADPLATLQSIQRAAEIKGYPWLAEQLPAFLERLTTEGVGDDIATAFWFPPHQSAANAAPVSSGPSDSGVSHD